MDMHDKRIEERSKILGYILIAAILIGVMANSFFQQEKAPSGRVTFRNDATMVLRTAAGETIEIPYASLTACELAESPDYGEPAGGSLTDGLMEGAWHSATLGDYVASVKTEIPCCAVIDAGGVRYAVNLESEAVTRSMVKSLRDVMSPGE